MNLQKRVKLPLKKLPKYSLFLKSFSFYKRRNVHFQFPLRSLFFYNFYFKKKNKIKINSIVENKISKVVKLSRSFDSQKNNVTKGFYIHNP